jgi:hypothetical protein
MCRATLRKMVASFGSAINDPTNALTHLYEIRDALAKYFGSRNAAETALQMGSRDWGEFGRIANDEPLLEGRHRGRHVGPLRHATPQELATVKDLAEEWIRKFASKL